MRTELLSLVALALVVACSTDPRTEVIVVVDSDLAVPAELDEITIEATSPSGETQSSVAPLGDGEPPLPRTLGLVHTGGSLGPFAVTATGLLGGTPVVSRAATFSFQEGQTLVLTMHLVRSCQTTACTGGQTCTESGCQTPSSSERLTVWTGTPPRLGEIPDMDMGTPGDACVAEVCNDMDDDCDGIVDEDVVAGDEMCNAIDDDCDGAVDEGFDLQSDVNNCGACGVACVFRNGSGMCNAGTCVITSCDAGFEDCDTDGVNGCEIDTTSNASNCGGCGNNCSGGTRICCASTCQRDPCM